MFNSCCEKLWGLYLVMYHIYIYIFMRVQLKSSSSFVVLCFQPDEDRWRTVRQKIDVYSGWVQLQLSRCNSSLVKFSCFQSNTHHFCWRKFYKKMKTDTTVAVYWKLQTLEEHWILNTFCELTEWEANHWGELPSLFHSMIHSSLLWALHLQPP